MYIHHTNVPASVTPQSQESLSVLFTAVSLAPTTVPGTLKEPHTYLWRELCHAKHDGRGLICI